MNRTIHRNVGNPEVNRLYTFNNEAEMTSLVEDYKKNFTRSVTILDSGKFNSTKAKFINTIATETWDDMNLKVDDFFLFTREDISKREEDAKRKEKNAKRGTFASKVPGTTLQPIKTRKSDWTKEEMEQLWSGTIKEVAEKLNKSYAIVYGKRKQYEEENPTFVIPDCAIYKREKKEKAPTVKATAKAEKPAKIVYKQTIAELTHAETDIMWKHSSMELRAQYPHIFQSIFVISALRTEYCKLHPEFVIPLSAKFNPAGLPNKVETKVRANAKPELKLTAGLTEDQMSVIWDTDAKQVGELIGKHYMAIYHARIAYCKANPTFEIPAVAKFVKPAELSNPIQKIEHKAEIEPAIIAKTKETIQETIVEQVTPVANISEKPATQPAAQPTAQQNTMAEMFTLLTASGMKPKKATFTKDGEVSFEF